MDPGRPHSPGINASRTRPEAEEFALKNKGTNDWFRHDGKNVQADTPPPSRHGSRTAKAIAGKYKGESEDWYVHKNGVPNGTVNGKVNGTVNGTVNGNYDSPKSKRYAGVMRCRTPDARRNFAKIKGTEESWYKHDNNKDFVSPRPKSRLTGTDAVDAKEKIMGKSGTEWYSHEHKGTNGYTPPRSKSRLGSANAKENAGKLRPTGPPVWASYDRNGTDSTDGSRPQSRLNNQGLEFQQRSKGSANDWFGHASNGTNGNAGEELMSPRRGSEESKSYADKQTKQCGNWYNHDANKNYVEPVKVARCRSASAREMIEKTRGHELDRVMNPETEQNHNGFHDAGIKPEAAEFAQKSVQGMMSKYLDQDANKDYQSARPGPRVKPEAEENLAKNKGVMGEFMEGYPDTPKKHDVRRIRPEAEDNANRNRGNAGRAITGDLPGSARKHPRIKGEAEKYAERNKGQKDLIGGFGGLQVSGTPIKHRSKEAEANAARWRGSEITGIFNMN